MTKLNQIIAVEKTVKADTARVFTDAYTVSQKAPLLAGIAKRYAPRDEEGEKLPGELNRVQVRVSEIVADVAVAMAKLIDLTATKDATNQIARADIVIDGHILAGDVPVSTLLSLEKHLADMAVFVRKLPLLDPSEKWTASTHETGVWETEPIRTVRTKKVPRNHVKAEATERHPAQVEVYHEDTVVGDWTTVKYSGAIPHRDAKDMLSRILVLSQAVKTAREQANMAQVVDRKIGLVLMGYLFPVGE